MTEQDAIKELLAILIAHNPSTWFDKNVQFLMEKLGYEVAGRLTKKPKKEIDDEKIYAELKPW